MLDVTVHIISIRDFVVRYYHWSVITIGNFQVTLLRDLQGIGHGFRVVREERLHFLQRTQVEFIRAK